MTIFCCHLSRQSLSTALVESIWHIGALNLFPLQENCQILKDITDGLSVGNIPSELAMANLDDSRRISHLKLGLSFPTDCRRIICQ